MTQLILHLRYALIGHTGGIISGPSANKKYLDVQVEHYQDAQVVPVYIRSSNMDENTDWDDEDSPLVIVGADEGAEELWGAVEEVATEAIQRAFRFMLTEVGDALSVMDIPKGLAAELLARMLLEDPTGPLDGPQK